MFFCRSARQNEVARELKVKNKQETLSISYCLIVLGTLTRGKDVKAASVTSPANSRTRDSESFIRPSVCCLRRRRAPPASLPLAWLPCRHISRLISRARYAARYIVGEAEHDRSFFVFLFATTTRDLTRVARRAGLSSFARFLLKTQICFLLN